MRKIIPLSKLVASTLFFVVTLAGQTNILTRHGDNARTGANLNEETLTVANVNSKQFGKLARRPVDGNIYAQPLIVSGAKAANRQRPTSLAIVATERNSVYAFDAEDVEQHSRSAEVWHTGPDVLGPSIDSFTLSTDIGIGACVDLTMDIGITGTPVIQLTKKSSPSEGVVFVAAKSKVGDTYHYTLFALNLADGSKVSSIEIEGEVPGEGLGSIGSGADAKVRFDPKLHLNRPGLLLVGKTLFIAFGGHCDGGFYHGWVFAYDVSNPKALKRTGILCTTPNGTGPRFREEVVEGAAGIWMAGEGPSVDDAGNIYLATGDGTYNKSTDFGNSVLKIRFGDGKFKVLDWFTPTNETDMKNFDLDLGSAGVVLLPRSHLMITGGKEGHMYLLDGDNLGKGTKSARETFQVTHKVNIPYAIYGLNGSPAIWARKKEVYVYTAGEEDPIRQFRLVPDASLGGWKFDPPGPFKTSSVTAPYAGAPAGFFDQPIRVSVWTPGGFMTLSAKDSLDASGILWVTMPVNGSANHDVVRGVLRALDASDVSKPELWNSENTGNEHDRLGYFAKFNPPTVANGKVYVATFQEEMLAGGTRTKNLQGEPPALVIYGLR